MLEKIRLLLPRETILYVADSAHAPYGARDAEDILGRCQEIMRFFRRRRAKAVVVACNTATAAAVTTLRTQFKLPLIGMEPPLKPAARQSRSGVVGVLATESTIDSNRFENLKRKFDGQAEIITQSCPGLVEHIERIAPDRTAIRKLLQRYMEPLLTQGADILVLGCSHFSLVTDLVAEVAGAGVHVMDTGFAVARQLAKRLELEGLLNDRQEPGEARFFTSGDVEYQQRLIAGYWGRAIAVASIYPDPRLRKR